MRNANRNHVRAFTLLEVLASVFVIILLIGLLIVGLNRAVQFAKRSGERQALTTMVVAISAFKSEYGFTPPLVKDVEIVRSANGRRIISVYQPSNEADRLFLRSPQNDYEPNDANPYADTRFSELSLGFYLAGACDEPVRLNAPPGGSDVIVPVDGVAGLGFLRPNADGSFDLPASYYAAPNPSNPDPQERRLVGSKSQSLLDLSGKSLRLEQSLNNVRQPLRLVDARGVPYRYYKWIQGKPSPSAPNTLIVEGVFDYNIPPLVGFTSDPAINPNLRIAPEFSLEEGVKLRNATWAIVGAGPNGVFGDENVSVLAQVLGENFPNGTVEERLLRGKASEDNVVEVGE